MMTKILNQTPTIMINQQTEELTYANKSACMYFQMDEASIKKLLFKDLGMPILNFEQEKLTLQATDYLMLQLKQKEQSNPISLYSLFKAIIQTTTDGVIITNQHKNIVWINPAFTQVTGYSFDEVIGKNPKILQSGLQTSQFYHQLWNTIEYTAHWQGEIWNKRKNGEVYPEWLHVFSIVLFVSTVTLNSQWLVTSIFPVQSLKLAFLNL